MGGGASAAQAAQALRAAGRDRALLRRVAGLFGPYRRAVAGIGGLILVTAGLGVVPPLLIKVVFDRGLFVAGGPDLPLVLLLCGAMVAATLVAAALGVWQAYLTNRVGQDVLRDLRGRLFTHLQRLSLRSFTGTRTGEIQSRLQNDVGGLQTVVTETASSILGNVVVIASTLVAMTVLSWQLTPLSLALLPVFVWLTGRVGRVRRNRAADVIFVIDQGRVVEQGDHEAMLARGGRYALFSQQYGDGLVEARCANGLRLSDGRVLQTTSPAA